MIKTLINRKWELYLPEHKAAFPKWDVWEKERIESLFLNMRNTDTVFDVGSEEFDIPALFAQWMGDNGNLVLIEPNPKIWRNGYEIWQKNGLKTPAACFVGFASNKTDFSSGASDTHKIYQHEWPECTFTHEMTNHHGFRHLSQETDSTPQIRLDDIVLSTGLTPDIINIDVEGSELTVIEGSENILTELKPLVYISIHHTFMIDMYKKSPQELLDLMEWFGYSRILLAIDHEIHVLFYHEKGRIPAELQ